MKKVFRTRLWVEDMVKAHGSDVVALRILRGSSWLRDCEGKPLEECQEMNYEICDEWLEEVEDDK